MKLTKKLRKHLGEKYSFARPVSDRDIFLLQRKPPQNFAETVVASLTVGCVKIEATLFKNKEKLSLCYDVYVKDTPDSDEWICYDNPTDTVKLKEAEMLSVLDRVVTENGLSYTECCFEKLNGKVISPRGEAERMTTVDRQKRPVLRFEVQTQASTRTKQTDKNSSNLRRIEPTTNSWENGEIGQICLARFCCRNKRVDLQPPRSSHCTATPSKFGLF